MRKSRAKRGMLVALVVLALIAIIGGTYARYSSTTTSNATIQVAKWYVDFKNGAGDTITTEAPLTFNVAASDDVAANRIAPGVTATSNASIALTGTEVGVDLEVSFNESDIQALFPGITTSRISASVQVNGETATTTATGSKYTATTTLTASEVAALSGNVPVVITVTWANDDNENTADTAIGTSATLSKTVPVTLKAQQHITTTP